MRYEITANRLRNILEERNISQQELADWTGINKASISQYVNGRNVPSSKNAQKMADILHVHPQWLMGFDTPEMIMSDPLEYLSEEEKNIIETFRNLDEESKRQMVLMLAFLKDQNNKQ